MRHHVEASQIRRQYEDQSVAARQFLVERLFPILARADAGFGVEIKKDFFVTEPLKRTRDIVG